MIKECICEIKCGIKVENKIIKLVDIVIVEFDKVY